MKKINRVWKTWDIKWINIHTWKSHKWNKIFIEKQFVEILAEKHPKFHEKRESTTPRKTMNSRTHYNQTVESQR